MYTPKQPFTVAAQILTASFDTVNGIPTKTFKAGDNFFCSARAYGGTEKIVDGKYLIEDTLTVETWYRPDLTSECRIEFLEDSSEWEILNTPEDIDLRHQFIRFKVRRYKGKA